MTAEESQKAAQRSSPPPPLLVLALHLGTLGEDRTNSALHGHCHLLHLSLWSPGTRILQRQPKPTEYFPVNSKLTSSRHHVHGVPPSRQVLQALCKSTRADTQIFPPQFPLYLSHSGDATGKKKSSSITKLISFLQE